MNRAFVGIVLLMLLIVFLSLIAYVDPYVFVRLWREHREAVVVATALWTVAIFSALAGGDDDGFPA